MYWGVTFSQEMKAKLLRVLDQFLGLKNYESWTEYADHITLIHFSHPDFSTANALLSNFEETNVDFKITGLGISSVAVAFEVNLHSTNTHTHITMFVKPGHKPVESNDIGLWHKAYCNETFTGKLKCLP